MLTNLTNLTRSATLTLLTNGTRSLAPVVDGNMLQVRFARRHVPILHFGHVAPAGMDPDPIDPESIRGDRSARIPGSPPVGGWPYLGRPQPSGSRSQGSPPSVVRGRVRPDVIGCRVVPVGLGAGHPASPAAAAATARAARASKAPAPVKAKAASKRPAFAGG